MVTVISLCLSEEGGVGDTRLGEPCSAKRAAVAPATRAAAAVRVVTAMGKPIIQAKRDAFPDDFGFAELLKRRMNTHSGSANALRSRQ